MGSSRSAVVLAFVAGALLIISGVTGSVGVVGMAFEYAINYFGGTVAEILSLVLEVLQYIASLGGLAVIGGGVLLHVGRIRLGKFIIGTGAGMGLLGFLVILGSALLHGWAHTVAFLLIISQSLGWIGIILAIVARRLVG